MTQKKKNMNSLIITICVMHARAVSVYVLVKALKVEILSARTNFAVHTSRRALLTKIERNITLIASSRAKNWGEQATSEEART